MPSPPQGSLLTAVRSRSLRDQEAAVPSTSDEETKVLDGSRDLCMFGVFKPQSGAPSRHSGVMCAPRPAPPYLSVSPAA